MGRGAADSRIAARARQNDFLVRTNGTDFLRPERRRGIAIPYCPENTLQAHEIAARVDEVGATIPDQADLPAVTWLREERRR